MNNQAEMLDIEENTRSIGDYINVVRRRKRVLAITASSVMAVIILSCFFMAKDVSFASDYSY